MVTSHWRDCHFADALSLSPLKHLLKVEGGASRMTVSPTANGHRCCGHSTVTWLQHPPIPRMVPPRVDMQRGKAAKGRDNERGFSISTLSPRNGSECGDQDETAAAAAASAPPLLSRLATLPELSVETGTPWWAHLRRPRRVFRTLN